MIYEICHIAAPRAMWFMILVKLPCCVVRLDKSSLASWKQAIMDITKDKLVKIDFLTQLDGHLFYHNPKPRKIVVTININKVY